MSSKDTVNMSEENSSLKWYESSYDSIESGLNGSRGTFLHATRKAAYNTLTHIGLPDAQNEEWKYTPTRDFTDGNFEVSSISEIRDRIGGIEGEALLAHAVTDLDAHCFVSIDGVFAKSLSDSTEKLPDKISVYSISELMDGKCEDSESVALFEKHFGEISSLETNSMCALNTTFTQDGVVVFVPKGVTVSKPIYIKHISSGMCTEASLDSSKNSKSSKNIVFPRVLLVAGENSSCSFIEQFITLDSTVSGYTASVTEVKVSEGAKVRHYLLGEDVNTAKNDVRYSLVSAHQEKSSDFRTTSISLGGGIIRNEVTPTLGGSGAFTGMYGLSVLNGTQHVDNHTVLDHAEPHCESDERYKGIYNDTSKGVFCGTIIVRPDAQKTNAIQNNQGLLLSDKASLATKPQLKIWADDVKCTHGATVGQLDQDRLFYLRSRGIGEKDAKNLLVQAFAGDVTKEIADTALRQYVEERVIAKLNA